MIGISMATKWEFEATLSHFSVKDGERFAYPYSEVYLILP